MSRSLGPSCRRCGKKLRAVYTFDTETVAKQNPLFPNDPSMAGVETREVRGRLLGYGYQGRSLFCSLTCGYRWACGEIAMREKEKKTS